MKLLLVVNPVSGDNDKEPYIKKIKDRLNSQDDLHIFETNGKDDLERLRRSFFGKYDRVVVIGGDGTIKLAAEAMGEHPVSIGIIPAGSANGLAIDLGLPLSPEEAIAVALGAKTRKIDAISLNGELCLHISDLGLNAELIKEYENSFLRGKLGYALNSIPALFRSKGPYDFTIETENRTCRARGIMLAFANSKKFGTGAVINPDGSIDDGIFEILIFKKLDVLEILKTLQETEKPSTGFMEVIPVKKARITTEEPVAFQVDGEYCQAVSEVRARVVPEKLEIVVAE
ncbi:diacylglycerol/lipid kinase family protein [Sinomicrobium soli]|uniref:diacylglycerol/lipid kinase family protein n=1 Tax=Sinomicrobium sp. N-1-3-6 TaxID=2219864 RepID=UPI000DCD1BDF|nr:diacylglycerol kinase family protein [Sinomicrobium sp. N-1-3-6]RAV30245.1 diacylglycerol kinase [Sinomicrobium sp. N-1-3-6]